MLKATGSEDAGEAGRFLSIGSPGQVGAEPARDIFAHDAYDPVFGRERELSRIAALWLTDRGVLAVSGGVGSGKSALARAAERTLLDEVEDPPAFRLSLKIGRKRGEARRVLFALEAGLRARRLIEVGLPGESLEAMALRIVGALRRNPGLVILDGLESVQHPPHIRGGRIKNSVLSMMVDLLAQPSGAGRRNCASLVLLLGGQVTQEAPEQRRMALSPLSANAGAKLLEAEGLRGAPEEFSAAARSFEGCPLALKRAARLVRRLTPQARPLKAAALFDIAADLLLDDPEGPIDMEARRAARALSAELDRVERLPPRASGRGGPEQALLTLASLKPGGLQMLDRLSLLEGPAIPGMTEGLLELQPIARKARLKFAERRLLALGLITASAEADDGAEEERGEERLVAPILVRAAVRTRLKAQAPEALRVAERRLERFCDKRRQEQNAKH